MGCTNLMVIMCKTISVDGSIIMIKLSFKNPYLIVVFAISSFGNVLCVSAKNGGGYFASI